MDQPADGEETFVLKTNLHSRACEKHMEVLILQHFPGVRRISIHPTEIGKFTISGTIDPRKLMKFLLKNGIKSEHVLEPTNNRRNLPNVSRSKHLIDSELVSGLEALAKLENLKTVEIEKNKMKLTYYKEDEKVQHLDGKTGSCSATNMHENAMHKNGKHAMNKDCDLHGNHESCCSRNQGMYTQYCDGCYSTNCGCMDPRESVPVGIPFPPPAYNPVEPSAPPLCSGDNPTGGFMFFLFCFLFLLIQAAL